MKIKLFTAVLTAVITVASADAAVVSYRATGIVTQTIGATALLPVEAHAGDAFVLNFSFDTTTADSIAFDGLGSYAIPSLSFSVGASPVLTASTARIAIQTGANSLWGVTGCVPLCSSPTDQVRLNLFFPAGTITSDALTLPPDPAGANVQFGLFSSDSTATQQAFVDVALSSITPVPLPAAAWLLLSGLGATTTLSRWRRRPPSEKAG